MAPTDDRKARTIMTITNTINSKHKVPRTHALTPVRPHPAGGSPSGPPKPCPGTGAEPLPAGSARAREAPRRGHGGGIYQDPGRSPALVDRRA